MNSQLSEPSDELLIRLIREDEFAAVSALTVEAYTSAYEIDAEGTYRAELGRVAERAAAHQVWVAVDRQTDEIVATVATPLAGEHLSSFALPTDMDFRMLAVSPLARGRGIGRVMVEHCMELARARGAARLILHTGDDMHLAVALYERMGFARVVEVEQNFPYPPGVWYPVRVYAMEL